MSDIEDDEFLDADFSSDKVDSLVKKCRNFVPNSCNANIANIKSTLNKANLIGKKGSTPKRKGLRSTEKGDFKQQFSDSLRALSTDAENFHKKIDHILEAFVCLIDAIENLENRISVLENNSTKQSETIPKASYASTLVGNGKSSSDRIEKLEFLNSEDERKKKSLQIAITHETISPGSNNLNENVSKFFSQKMCMSPREIDQNFSVIKSKRENTVIVQFSERRFKLNLFKARKRLRSSDESNVRGLFLNDNLTAYNFGILKKLKHLKKTRADAGESVYESVYSIDGRVFVKMRRGDHNNDAIHVKTISCLEKLLGRLNDAVTHSNQ